MARREERPIVIPGADDPSLALEGIFVAGEEGNPRGAVVAPPHPLYGGHLESPVVGEVAHACGKQGMATVRFNWRGVGASGGERSGDAQHAVSDYGQALEHLAETVDGPLVACGYSFGAATALAAGARHPRVERMILVAPPASMMDASLLEGFAGRVLLVAGGADQIAPAEPLLEWVEGSERHVLEQIPEADHFFMAGLAALGRVTTAWLESPL
ncbi:MAG: alpha/beta hydrolase [Myxococcota bacterium]